MSISFYTRANGLSNVFMIGFCFVLLLHCSALSQAAADEIEASIFSDFESEYGTGETADEAWDPLKPYNIFMYQINDTVYTYVLRPTARFYRNVPKPARKGIHNFFVNIRFPIDLVNNLLQGKWHEAGVTTGRFVVNTTVGVLGFMDKASDFGMKAAPEDFGQTLGSMGVPGGCPIVLPIIGISNLRDTGGRFMDGFLNPINYIGQEDVTIGCHALYHINEFSLSLEFIDQLKGEAVDEYIFFRNAYRQSRAQKIKE